MEGPCRRPPHLPARPLPARRPSRALLSQGLQLKRHIDATLGQGDILAAVRLPPGEDLKEWLAVNTVRRRGGAGGFAAFGPWQHALRSLCPRCRPTPLRPAQPPLRRTHPSTAPQVDFYNAVSVLYSTLVEFCTDRSCEVMSAGGKVGAPLGGGHFGGPGVAAAQGTRRAAEGRRRCERQRRNAGAARPRRRPHINGIRLLPQPKPSPTPQFEYLWADGVKYKKPVRLSAPDYINKLFDWVEAQVGRAGGSRAGARRGVQQAMMQPSRWQRGCIAGRQGPPLVHRAGARP
jgi:hypothetical protein